MQQIQSITEVSELKGKRVIVRTSLDVPMVDGVIQSSFRLVRAIPTIAHLVHAGARVILLTHVGRDPKNSTEPLARALSEYVPVTYVPGVTGAVVETAVAALKDGEVILLENLRREAGEEANDPIFAGTLASYADYYVNDAFAVSHRAHASIVGIPTLLPHYGGITFMKEYEELGKVLRPETPALFILGGAKFETKALLVEAYAEHYSQVFVGGAIANDFLKGKGLEVGESLLSDVDMTGNPLLTKENVILPYDAVVGGGDGIREVLVEHVLPTDKILDVGPRSIELLAPYIANAKTILWNGPLGNYEGGFDQATKSCAKLIAESAAYSVVGGGDTVTAIESLNIEDSFGFLSTSGGAMLHFLEHETLPGLEALAHRE